MSDKEIETDAVDDKQSNEQVQDTPDNKTNSEENSPLAEPNNSEVEPEEPSAQSEPDQNIDEEPNDKNIQPENEHKTDTSYQEEEPGEPSEQSEPDQNIDEEPNDNNIQPEGGLETDTSHQEEIEKLSLTDIDLPSDEFDEENETAGGKRKWILIGSIIVLIAVIAGAGLFYFSDQNPSNKNDRTKKVALSLKIPSKSKLKKGRKKMISSSQKLLKSSPSSARPKDTIKQKKLGEIKPIKKSQPNQIVKTQETNKIKKDSPDFAKAVKLKGNKKAATKSRKALQSNSGAKILADGSLILPSVTAAAYKGIPMMKDPRPLADPDKSLGERVGAGVIPKISTDGRRPWKFYGKSFSKQNTLPRVSIIIKDLGLSRAATTAAINNTPSEITLAFNPYAKGVGNWVGLARAVGHETLITLPMEPIDFPVSDPGPFALQVDLQQTENIDRLRYILSVSMGNVGLLQMMGTRFVRSQKALEPILKEIHSRGLLMIDDGLTKESRIVKIASSIGLPIVRSDLLLDLDASRSGIINKLSELVAIAKKNKSAVGIAQPLPNSISLIMNWVGTLEKKGIDLAPITAVVKIPGSLKSKAKAPSGGQ